MERLCLDHATELTSEQNGPDRRADSASVMVVDRSAPSGAPGSPVPTGQPYGSTLAFRLGTGGHGMAYTSAACASQGAAGQGYAGYFTCAYGGSRRRR